MISASSRSASRTTLVVAAAVIVSLPYRDVTAQTTASTPSGAQVATLPRRPSAPPPVGLGGQLASWLQLRGEAPEQRRLGNDRKLALTHNLGGYPGEMVSFVSILGTERD